MPFYRWYQGLANGYPLAALSMHYPSASVLFVRSAREHTQQK